MQVTLIGLGCGTAATMTVEGREALLQADCVLGAARLLAGLPEGCTPNRLAAVQPETILEELLEQRPERPCVVFSGDTGFYSGARRLRPLLEARGLSCRLLPGLSSVQLLAARLGRPWQDWNLCSAHGTDCDAVTAVMQGRPAFFLTGGALGPAELCREWTAAGLGGLAVTVGEDLSYENEQISCGTAAEFADRQFAPLAVVLAESAPEPLPRRTPGLEDDLFLRGRVPMTKQEVRAAVLAKLAVRPEETVWDVGAGTGSVSVELARGACRGRVFAIECQEEACGLIRRNRERFGAWNLTLVAGTAPEALSGLPVPDAVFIGGTRGKLEAVIEAVLDANPKAHLCISAIALETLAAATAALTARGLAVEVSQIGVSRTREAGELHLLTANNPVFLISARAGEETV